MCRNFEKFAFLGIYGVTTQNCTAEPQKINLQGPNYSDTRLIGSKKILCPAIGGELCQWRARCKNLQENAIFSKNFNFQVPCGTIESQNFEKRFWVLSFLIPKNSFQSSPHDFSKKVVFRPTLVLTSQSTSLFGEKVSTYLPTYIHIVRLILWTFLASNLSELGYNFVGSSSYYKFKWGV